MRRHGCIALIAALVWTAVLSYGQPASTNGPPRVALDLVDGGRVIGRPESATLHVAAPFAEMAIPLRGLSEVTFLEDHESVRAELENGDKITGKLRSPAFVVTALFGTVTVANQHVARLTVLRTGLALALLPTGAERDRSIEAKMRAITIPEIDFRQARLHDVIDFLAMASVEFDRSDAPSGAKGVNMVVHLPPEAQAAAPADPFAEPAAGNRVPTITFRARQISLLEALRLVVRVAGVSYVVRDGVVMIERLEAP